MQWRCYQCIRQKPGRSQKEILFYDAHREIDDCYATLNLLIQNPKEFENLKASAYTVSTLICGIDAPFSARAKLKKRGYHWNDGESGLPKSWSTMISGRAAGREELLWLVENVYGSENKARAIQTAELTSRERYSERAHQYLSGVDASLLVG